jgi:dihydroxyacetone kinase-like protein
LRAERAWAIPGKRNFDDRPPAHTNVPSMSPPGKGGLRVCSEANILLLLGLPCSFARCAFHTNPQRHCSDMTQTIGNDDISRMLRAAAVLIRDNESRLSKLDSFGGDGDHGSTMVRAMKKMEEALNAPPKEGAGPRSLKDLLYDIGWAIMGVDGGATGPLLGAFFMGMSMAVGDRDALDAQALAEVFGAGLAGVRQQSKARIGDKTMIDALMPAVETLLSSSAEGADIPALLRAAADAAAKGAESTSEMQARYGRAKNIGEKSIGQPDPGATSISLIFEGFANA